MSEVGWIWSAMVGKWWRVEALLWLSGGWGGGGGSTRIA